MESIRSSSRPLHKLKPKKLSPQFYNRNTKKVARDLLGKRLVHIYKGKRLSGIIVETEAYLGVIDPAAHTYKGRRTPRTEVMWGEGGHAYIYFIYGMHFCINAVTLSHGRPEAVLIRAVECDNGLAQIKKLRQISIKKNLANGPGKLCQALHLTRKENGLSLRSKSLFIEDVGTKIPHNQICIKPRIGVDYAGHAAKWPLRFYIRNNIYISKK